MDAKRIKALRKTCLEVQTLRDARHASYLQECLDTIEELNAWKEDMEDSTRAAMSERCDASERHCTCVPLLRAEVKRLQAVTVPLDALREPEGATVTIICDNPEFGPPNSVVRVSDNWTGCSVQAFTGDSLAEALQSAVEAMEQVESKGDEPC